MCMKARGEGKESSELAMHYNYAGLAKVMRRRQFLMRTELPNKWRSGAWAWGSAA